MVQVWYCMEDTIEGKKSYSCTWRGLRAWDSRASQNILIISTRRHCLLDRKEVKHRLAMTRT